MGDKQQHLRKILVLTILIINTLLLPLHVKQFSATNIQPKEIAIKNPINEDRVSFLKMENGTILRFSEERLSIYDLTANGKPVLTGKFKLETIVYTAFIHKTLLFLIIKDQNNEFAVVWYNLTTKNELEFLGKERLFFDFFDDCIDFIITEKDNELFFVILKRTDFFLLQINLETGLYAFFWKQAAITHNGLSLNCSIILKSLTQDESDIFVTFDMEENSTIGIAQLQHFISGVPCFELLGTCNETRTDFGHKFYRRNDLIYDVAGSYGWYREITVCNISAMNKLTEIYSYKDFVIAKKAVFTENLVFSSYGRTIYVYDLIAENNTELIGKYTCPKTSSDSGDFYAIDFVDDYLYCFQSTTNQKEELYCIIDVSDLANLSLVGAFGISPTTTTAKIIQGFIIGAICLAIIIPSSLLVRMGLKKYKKKKEKKKGLDNNQ